MISLGIDSGTQSTKTIALDLESGKILASAAQSYGLIEGLPPGHLEQEPQQWVDAARGAELEELALFLVDCHEHENDLQAIECWYAAETWSADAEVKQEEQTYVWGLLKANSKLRSAIKANHPDRLAEAAAKAAAEALKAA